MKASVSQHKHERVKGHMLAHDGVAGIEGGCRASDMPDMTLAAMKRSLAAEGSPNIIVKMTTASDAGPMSGGR